VVAWRAIRQVESVRQNWSRWPESRQIMRPLQVSVAQSVRLELLEAVPPQRRVDRSVYMDGTTISRMRPSPTSTRWRCRVQHVVNILVQVDRISGYDTTNGDWTDTRPPGSCRTPTRPPFDYAYEPGRAEHGRASHADELHQWARVRTRRSLRPVLWTTARTSGVCWMIRMRQPYIA